MDQEIRDQQRGLTARLRADFMFGRWRPDCLAGHIGLEPANPGAGHLIGFA
jgi:hypothetical protein